MKTVAVNFWLIFNRDDEMVETPRPQPPVTKELLKKIHGTQSKIHVYAHQGPEPVRVEGRSPDFQIEIIKAAMEERLRKEEIPYDEVMIEKPKYADVHLNSEITEHVNWENVLLGKLMPGKTGRLK